MSEEKQNLGVEGIVAARNKEPYIVLFRDKERIAQMDVASARSFANDIVQMCARTEADAVLARFFARLEFPDGALAALLRDFRDFRLELDTQAVDREWSKPRSEERQ